MDINEIEAARNLIAFARDHAEDVYEPDEDDGNEDGGGRSNFNRIHDAADIIERFLNIN